jgi:hypothetical protein
MPPPPAALAGVWAKIDWANQHLKQFDGLGAYINQTNPDLIGHKEDPNAGQRHYYLRRDPIIPVESALLAGDILQSLRSALDHLAFALCVAGPSGKAAADRMVKGIQFPITTGDATDYKALNARGVVVALSKPGVENALDATEPYKGGAGELLSQLGALNNTDKHRLLVTVALQVPAIDIGSMHFERWRKYPWLAELAALPPERFALFINPADKSVLKAGDIIFSEPLDAELHEKVNFKFPIALNEPQILPVQPLTEILKKMTDLVSGLVPKFDSFV